MNELQTTLSPLPANDGWADAADEAAGRMIKGTLLKFADWRWTTGKESAPVPPGKRLAALGTAAAWVRWADKKPVEHIIRAPGGRLPDREDLSHTDESAWEAGLGGEARDPWQNSRFVYLVDPTTAEAFTFSTSTWGGHDAVRTLGDQIERMRRAQPNATPIVELEAAEMQTKRGRKSKPIFKVVDWRIAPPTEGGPPPTPKPLPSEPETLSAEPPKGAKGRGKITITSGRSKHLDDLAKRRPDLAREIKPDPDDGLDKLPF